MTISKLLDLGWEEVWDETRYKLDKIKETGREQETVEGESREDSEKYFEQVLESKDIESGERYGGEKDDVDDGDDVG